jgi:hypothetical protein
MKPQLLSKVCPSFHPSPFRFKSCRILDLTTVDPDSFKNKLLSSGFSFVTVRDLPGQDGQRAFYYFAKLFSNAPLYVELKFKAGVNACKVTVKSSSKSSAEFSKFGLVKVLS